MNSKQAYLGTAMKFILINTGLRMISMLNHHARREKKTESWLCFLFSWLMQVRKVMADASETRIALLLFNWVT